MNKMLTKSVILLHLVVSAYMYLLSAVHMEPLGLYVLFPFYVLFFALLVGYVWLIYFIFRKRKMRVLRYMQFVLMLMPQLYFVWVLFYVPYGQRQNIVSPNGEYKIALSDIVEEVHSNNLYDYSGCFIQSFKIIANGGRVDFEFELDRESYISDYSWLWDSDGRAWLSWNYNSYSNTRYFEKTDSGWGVHRWLKYNKEGVVNDIMPPLGLHIDKMAKPIDLGGQVLINGDYVLEREEINNSSEGEPFYAKGKVYTIDPLYTNDMIEICGGNDPEVEFVIKRVEDRYEEYRTRYCGVPMKEIICMWGIDNELWVYDTKYNLLFNARKRDGVWEELYDYE